MKQYNKKHTLMKFVIGDKVLLHTKNLRTLCPSRKLDDKYFGPFEIEDVVRLQVYCLQLPVSYGKIHPTFHVSLLEPYCQQVGEEPPNPPAVLVEGELEYEVEAILKKRTC